MIFFFFELFLCKKLKNYFVFHFAELLYEEEFVNNQVLNVNLNPFIIKRILYKIYS